MNCTQRHREYKKTETTSSTAYRTGFDFLVYLVSDRKISRFFFTEWGKSFTQKYETHKIIPEKDFLHLL